MVQVYFFTEIYLLLSAAIILGDRYGTSWLFLFNLKAQFEEKRSNRIFGIIAGLLLLMALCIFPMDPGPVFLGDLLPEINVLLIVIRLLMTETKEEISEKLGLGYFSVITVIIHMIFPSIVIL